MRSPLRVRPLSMPTCARGMAKTTREEGFEEISDWFETLAKAEKSPCRPLYEIARKRQLKQPRSLRSGGLCRLSWISERQFEANAEHDWREYEERRKQVPHAGRT